MSDVTIRLVYNLQTGKKDIWIDYESDSDALPIEHEQQHRQFVEQLLGKGILNEDEVGQVRVSRGASAPAEQQQSQTSQSQASQPGQSAEQDA